MAAAAPATIRQLTILGDGAGLDLDLADEHFPAATQIVDLYHAREYVHDLAILAARLVRNGQPAWLAERLEETRRRRHPRPAHRSPRPELHRLLARERDKALGYFETNACRMQYARFRALGLFVGSGAVEARCKAVIGQRLKLSGMRWSQLGATGILTCAAGKRAVAGKGIWTQPHDQTTAA